MLKKKKKEQPFRLCTFWLLLFNKVIPFRVLCITTTERFLYEFYAFLFHLKPCYRNSYKVCKFTDFGRRWTRCCNLNEVWKFLSPVVLLRAHCLTANCIKVLCGLQLTVHNCIVVNELTVRAKAPADVKIM